MNAGEKDSLKFLKYTVVGDPPFYNPELIPLPLPGS